MDLKQRRLIINADDLGLSPGVTAGILYAINMGLFPARLPWLLQDFQRIVCRKLNTILI